MNGVRCVLWVLGVILCMLFCMLPCVLPCVLLVCCCVCCYVCGGHGGRDPFVRGAGVMRYAMELHVLRAVSAGSCASCAGGREGRPACAVGVVMCWVMYAGGCALCARDAGRHAPCCSVCWRPCSESSVCWGCWR